MTDLATAERNARATFARDPLECVAITAEAACALFDRLAEAEGTLAIVRRDFSGPAKPTHHRCQHCLIAAGIDERAWLCAEQFTDRALIEHLLTCHNDPSGVIIGALRDQQLELKRILSVARAEVADIRRDRDERLAALADANKRLDILRTAFEAETGKAWSI